MDQSVWLIEARSGGEIQRLASDSESTVRIECKFDKIKVAERLFLTTSETCETRLQDHTFEQVNVFLKVLYGFPHQFLAGEQFNTVLTCAKAVEQTQLKEKLTASCLLNTLLLNKEIDEKLATACSGQLNTLGICKVRRTVYYALKRALELWTSDLEAALTVIRPEKFPNSLPILTLFARGCIAQGKKKLGLQHLKKASGNSHGPASVFYGQHLLEEQELVEGFACFTQAAANGVIKAIRLVGDCCAKGIATSAVWKEAKQRYIHAAKAGDLVSMYNIGRHYYEVDKYSKAANWWKQSAEDNCPRSQHNYALLLFKGLGVNKDRKLSLEWSIRSANNGNKTSRRNVGLCYFYGRGCEINYEMALDWFAPLLEAGEPNAQYCYSLCYLNGWGGLTKNSDKARELIGLAADQGHKKAKEMQPYV